MRPGLLAAFLVISLPVCAQDVPTAALPLDVTARSQGIVRQIDFVGLRRVSPEALRPRIALREGMPLDTRLVERDVRVLDDLGWFDSVSVSVEVLPVQLAAVFPARPGGGATGFPAGLLGGSVPLLRLTFAFVERPFLAGVDFLGSRLLESSEIENVLASNGLQLRLARPSNRTELWRASRAIESALAERGRPKAHAQVHLVALPSDAVRAEFRIEDGPFVSVGRVDFLGNTAFSSKKLRKKMDRIAPHAFFAGLRGKDIYTPDRFLQDRERIERYYRNHGYPQARLGEAQVEIVKKKVLDWLPWPRRRVEEQFRISIPVQEGPRYRLDSIRVEGPGLDLQDGLPERLERFTPGEPYSEEKLLRARDELERLPLLRNPDGSLRHAVDLDQRFDPAAGTFSVVLRARPTDAYIVRRIEITGHHRFGDRFYLRRVGLAEGEPFDADRLQQGLQRLAATGFIHPVRPENVQLTWDQEKRTVDIRIEVEEIGRQRISLLGGASGWSSTLGVAYNLFDVLGGEELITGQLEGGPDSLLLAFHLTRDSLFGSRGTFAWSLYHNVVRPRLPGSGGNERLFTARTTGFAQNWSLPVGRRDTMAFNYNFGSTATRIPLAFAPDGQAFERRSTRSVLGATWERKEDSQRLTLSASLAGGPLAGGQHTLGATAEYARLARDPLSSGRNTWAFRGFLGGIAAHPGQSLPLDLRLFGGPQLMRGMDAAELTPYTRVVTTDAAGKAITRWQPTGSTLIAAANLEYRIPAAGTVETVPFFDAGLAALIPGWTGYSNSAHPEPLVRAAAGVELRFKLPATVGGVPNPLAGKTLRLHYAVDPLAVAGRLLRAEEDGVRLPGRRAALGWALGSLF
jgi:outer membrane protein assembly complex protein YaeT